MSALQNRARAAITKVGDAFTVAGNARVGWFRLCSYGRALLYATPAEVDTYSRPLWLLTIPHDDPTGIGDTVSWNSASLTVRKATDIRFRDAVVVRLLLIS